MSHEIRTPMNSILGMSELIMRKNLSSEVHEYISIISQAGKTLLSIINDILDFSRIESGLFQVESKEYHFSSLLNDVINVIRVRLVERSLDFFVSVNSHIPAKLIGDEVKIRQILINLLNNAIKYTRKGYISLEVTQEIIDAFKLRLTFKITDTGIGIKESDIQVLFDEFSRVDMDRNQGIEGTGLGLPIANMLCRAMGGEILVSSTYGNGSVFTASVIQSFGDTQRLAQVNRPEKKRVLVFEDRPAYAASFETAMKQLEINPVYTSNLLAFTRELGEGSYDFAFVSSNYAMDCISVWGKRSVPMQLIIMVELGEVSVYRDTGTILMPVYSKTLANVLNGINEESRSYDDLIHFTAPDARILIVDDITTNLKVAVELMAPYKMKIDTCISGETAIQMVKESLYREDYYDLVFMDHMMPEMDGIEATSRIRVIDKNAPYYQKLPVIMLTANAVSGQKEMFLENGIDDFLAKPIEMQKLAAVLEKWIPRKKQFEIVGVLTNSREHENIPEIKGVNIRQGINNTGGSLSAYTDILSVFYRDVRERTGEIKETAEARDLARYTTLVHALKSASRSIGAAELGDMAEQLEDAGNHRNLALIEEKTAGFLEQLAFITGNIFAALERYSSSKEKSTTVDLPASELDSLKEALNNMDIEAVNEKMENIRGLSLDAKAREFIGELEQNILLFEYDKAVTQINSFLVAGTH
jgi:CheY-like chemotaxis protein/HPt (histidine-containing phosphotransfer) domain-containing protein